MAVRLSPSSRDSPLLGWSSESERGMECSGMVTDLLTRRDGGLRSRFKYCTGLPGDNGDNHILFGSIRVITWAAKGAEEEPFKSGPCMAPLQNSTRRTGQAVRLDVALFIHPLYIGIVEYYPSLALIAGVTTNTVNQDNMF
jgi:hypothetical protein